MGVGVGLGSRVGVMVAVTVISAMTCSVGGGTVSGVATVVAVSVGAIASFSSVGGNTTVAGGGGGAVNVSVGGRVGVLSRELTRFVIPQPTSNRNIGTSQIKQECDETFAIIHLLCKTSQSVRQWERL